MIKNEDNKFIRMLEEKGITSKESLKLVMLRDDIFHFLITKIDTKNTNVTDIIKISNDLVFSNSKFMRYILELR